MKVMITGNLGYIGQVATRLFLENSFDVIGYDAGIYPCQKESVQGIVQITKDIRDVTKSDLSGIDVIIHLAALSNDPTSELSLEWTKEINYLATENFAKVAKSAGVKKFLFSSSCSVYGISDEILSENSSCNPLSEYARSKLHAEKSLMRLNDDKFCVTILRNGTAYGASPRMRLDLVVNNMIGHYMAYGTIKLLSNGQAWRPLVHIHDISKAFLFASQQDLRGEIFNVGCDSQNFQTISIAKAISNVIPGSKIEFSENAQPDKRSYRVDFSKISDLGFKPSFTLDNGITEIHEFLKSIGFQADRFDESSFHNIKFLKSLIEKGDVDNELRLKRPVSA
jgi:nucleoside-diphosphate-sugar epimerase